MQYVAVAMDVILPATARNLRSTLRAVYLALRSFSNGNYEPVYPSYAQIAERAGLKSTRTIYNAVRELENAGLITVEFKAVSGRVNRYHFCHFTHESNAGGYAIDSCVKKNHNHRKEESDSSLHRNLMRTTKNHLNQNHYPESVEQESPTHSPSPEDERLIDSIYDYFNQAANDYNHFTPNESFVLKTAQALKNRFDNLQPFDLQLFIRHYKKNVRAAETGAEYRLPIKPEPLARHLENWIGSRAREVAVRLAALGYDVASMSEQQITSVHIRLEYGVSEDGH